MRILALAALLLLATLAGCVGDGPSGRDGAVPPAPATDLALLLDASLAQGLAAPTFTEQVVTAAVGFANDLYEPTIEVCDDGSIYITGHTILVDTTGAPVFGSHDGGQTWAQLPFLQGLSMPSSMHGATPPPSDEIFLACGDGGWLYGADITLATFPVNAWSGHGTRHAYHNPNAYDEAEVRDADTESGCVPAPAKDRPWAAYSNGTLLMVSNPASGPAQVGVLHVPPALPLGIGATVGGASWNLCAGPGTTPASCGIPGIPDVRADGAFAVPQRCQGKLWMVVGDTEDIGAVTSVPLFDHTSAGEITSVYGIAAFDADGTLFAGITNNTWHREQTGVDRLGRPVMSNVADNGTLRFAVSRDAGQTFAERAYTSERPVRHFYMDANEKGPGALVVWATDGGNASADGPATTWDWYVGHLRLGADGLPELANAFLAIDEGPRPSAHVTGAAVGPDGRAYLAMYRSVPALSGGTPLSVYVQQDGVTLPVTA
jgi:hypothetical protein